MNTTTAMSNAALSASSNPPALKDTTALIGRVLLAAIFILSGASKIGAAEGTIGYIASVGLPFAETIYAATIALELVGGVALIIGLKTRVVASVLAAFSIAAAVMFHADFADQNQFIHFLKNLALAGGLLQVVAFGGGRFALDRK